LATHELFGGLRLAVEAWQTASAAFTPRLDGDGEALLESGFWNPGGAAEGEPGARETRHAEVRLASGHGERSLRIGYAVREIDALLGVDPELAGLLAPELRGDEPWDALAGSLRCRATYAALRLPLVLGARIGADGLLLLAPEAERLPVLMPRYRARVVFALVQHLFQRDLRLEGRLIGQFRDTWMTPRGETPRLERFDAEIHATVGRAHIFFGFRNLENDVDPSATHADDAWMPLPYRSTEAGVEWHFLD
jgi:hypothetical protein